MAAVADETLLKISAFDETTHEEKAAAKCAQLYATHKARGSLGTYFQMFPDDAPPEYWDPPRSRGSEGRER